LRRRDAEHLPESTLQLRLGAVGDRGEFADTNLLRHVRLHVVHDVLQPFEFHVLIGVGVQVPAHRHEADEFPGIVAADREFRGQVPTQLTVRALDDFELIVHGSAGCVDLTVLLFIPFCQLRPEVVAGGGADDVPLRLLAGPSDEGGVRFEIPAVKILCAEDDVDQRFHEAQQLPLARKQAPIGRVV